ncbi:MAG TPA: DUF4209 domain-containing protein, partial [Candidatus Angelobacter sp.]|nr:DUF4209 domain-containing protein [Candidatus Angelobacter sp.]
LTVLYIDRRGLNIRNDLTHGLMEMDRFNRAIADRVFHSLLVLALIRAVPKPDTDDAGQGKTTGENTAPPSDPGAPSA